MNLLFVTGVYPPRIGGPSIQTYKLARLCRSRGWDVKVVTFGETSSTRSEEGIEAHTVAERPGGPAAKYARAMAAIHGLCRKDRPDLVVHQTGVDYLAFVTGVTVSRLRLRSFIKHAGDLAWERLTRLTNENALGSIPLHDSSLSARILIGMERMALARFDRVWSLSKPQSDFLENVLRVPRDKIFQHRNLADLPRRVPPPRRKNTPPRILTVSRLIQRKNLDVLVRACALLSPHSFHLDVVGGGYEVIRRRLEKLIGELDLAGHVTLHGEVSPLKMGPFYRRADLFVLPSIYEHFALAVAEAMGHGLPIISTRVWGIEDAVIQGRNGYVVERSEPDDLAAAMDRLLRNRGARETMSRRSFERSRLFDINKHGDDILNEYERVATEGTHPKLQGNTRKVFRNLAKGVAAV